MQEAAPLIEGEHDFTSFAAVDAERGKGENISNVRQVFSSRWRRDDDEFIYEVRGNGFLHHMVRNLVGTCLLAGKGTLRPRDMITILEAKNRSAAGATAPASGLYLVQRAPSTWESSCPRSTSANSCATSRSQRRLCAILSPTRPQAGTARSKSCCFHSRFSESATPKKPLRRGRYDSNG